MVGVFAATPNEESMSPLHPRETSKEKRARGQADQSVAGIETVLLSAEVEVEVGEFLSRNP